MTDRGFFSRLARRDASRTRKRAETLDAKAEPVKAAALWRELAEAGDLEACHTLGERYEAGQGVVQNFVEAASWFRKGAAGGLTKSQAKLGDIYFHGRALPGSVSAGVAFVTNGAERPGGALGSLFPGGLAIPPDFPEAAKWNLAAADADDAPAQVRWAVQCAAGLGVAADYAEARHFFAAAAAKGHDGGALGLGVLHAGGQLGEADLPAAAGWFEKAASAGNSAAQLSLGLLLWRGEGVAQDVPRAADLIASAADAGQLEAMYLTGQFRRFGVGGAPDASTAE